MLDAGFRAFQASTLSEFQQVIDTEKVDLILADYSATGALHPDGHGFTRFYTRAHGIPIVVMTGQFKVDLMSLSHLGAVDVIEKPFDNGDLLLRLNAALASARLRNPIPL